MSLEDQIRSIESRLTFLEKERTGLLNELRNLRTQKSCKDSLVLLGRSVAMKLPETNEEKAD